MVMDAGAGRYTLIFVHKLKTEQRRGHHEYNNFYGTFGKKRIQSYSEHFRRHECSGHCHFTF